MERPSYWKRARQRAWEETHASIKGRFTPLLIAVLGVVVGYLYNLLFLHKQTAKEMVTVALVSGIGANIVWIVCVFVVNTLRVPWLLDVESTNLINVQETRAVSAEAELTEISAARKKHDLFGQLTQQGVGFSCQIAECQTDAQFASWDRHSYEWLKSVQQAMRDMGFPTDAVEFARSGEYAEPIKGVINTGNKQLERARELEKRQEYLADFVQRRLS